MSDPVSNSEIEDVLASIRRLVSENAKALKGDRARDPEAEKLVLTPALRIDESEAPPAPADVFAVDTDTWNDVSGKQEDAENKGVFSHREQHAPAVADAAGEVDEAATAAADEALEAEGAAGAAADEPAEAPQGEDARNAGSNDGDEVPEPTLSDAEVRAETESAPQARSAASALEQRIAELETAMDLRPADGKPAEAGAPDAGQGDEITHPEASDAAATDAAEKPAAAASDAPPKSWIEGLVAAAAAAEAARLAERAKAREDTAKPAEPEVAAGSDEIGEAEAGEPVSEGAAEEGVAETDTDSADAGTAEFVADTKPFELTAEHAAPVEPEAVAPAGEDLDAIEEPTAGEGPVWEAVESGEDDNLADEIGAVAEEEAAGDIAEVPGTAGEEAISETASEEAKVGEEDDAAAEAEAAGPERSWVDRLIAAAATLRGAPEAEAADKDETAEETAKEPDSEEDTADSPVDEPVFEAAAEEIEGEETDAGQPEETDVAPALEPLNLVDPIATKSEPESAIPEWEPVDPAELATNEAEEPVVDVDTVLTGPWTATEADKAEDAAPEAETAEDMAAVAEAETLAEAEEVAADAASAVAQEVPVGALEWERVEPLEQAVAEDKAAPETEDMDGEADTVEDTDAAESDVAFEDGEDDDVAVEETSEDVDFQEEAQPEPEAEAAEDDAQPAAEEGGESDAIDEDAAAVAAAAEADVDWGDAGMAAAGVAAMTATLGAAPDADEESAAGETVEVAPEEETVIDEAMLRELVAQIVRDELQGAVGERITHNVRRLIRREIARALTLQDFEK